MELTMKKRLERLSDKELIFCYKTCAITDQREKALKIKEELHRRYPNLEYTEE